MADTVRGLRDLVHVASTRGAAHARLQLHPAELGSIEVRIKVTREGVSATIAAERPEAVQALQQAGAELRRSLEDRGMTVLDVQVALAADAHAHQQHDSRPGDGAAAAAATAGRDSDQTTTTGGTDAAGADETTTRLPAGVLVDVLA
jgi:flagellar hook-length control protein FliK